LQLWIEHIRLVSDIALTKETLVTSMLTSVIQLDDIIEKMVNNILHHPQLQSLEASWRSIEYLIDQQEKNDKIQKIKIKILNCSWVSLSKDLDKSIEYNQSKFYSLINSEEFDHSGGEPFGLIAGDYTITNKNISGSYINDIDTLKVLALVCAAKAIYEIQVV
jgi:type VI secretion system protein ImpD